MSLLDRVSAWIRDESEISASSGVPGVSSGLSPFTWAPLTGTTRAAAMSLPTVQRARDVLCGGLAQVELAAYLYDRLTRTTTAHPSPPTWLERPDPDRTRGALIADTADDLIFHGYALWRVATRDAAGWPATFRHAPVVLTTRNSDGTWRIADAPHATGLDRIANRDMIVFESTQTGVLNHGTNTIEHATRLEVAAMRFAATEVPAGWLQQTGGVPLTPTERAAMAGDFVAARATNTVAFLSEEVAWHESQYDPSRLQLVESRQHSATDQARIMNVPAALVHAPTNDSLTYSNEADQRADLWHFGLAALASTISETLSGPNVTPRGTIVKFDPENVLAAADTVATTTRESETV